VSKDSAGSVQGSELERTLAGEVCGAFIQQARRLLIGEYLPKIERCLENLTDEQIWWRANQASNSIGNLLLHLAGNSRQWIISGLGNEPDRRQRDLEFARREQIPRSELLSKFKGTLLEVDQVLARFDATTILAPRKIQGTEVSGLEAIFHVTEHFAMHTGQIILLTKLLTATDLHFYDFEEEVPSQRWLPDPS
jgi:uncharacterized damage-inducible protein DinB